MPDIGAYSTGANLRLVGWNGSSWVDLSGAPTATGTGENSTLSGIMIAGISAIGIGSIAYPLPLKLIDFSVRRDGQKGLLSWVTASEDNTDYFVVEESTNAQHFHSIGRVEAYANIDLENHYSFAHEQPAAGVHYYRLRIVDKDNSAEYSPVRTLTFSENINTNMTLFPNPAMSIAIVRGIKEGSVICILTMNGTKIVELRAITNTATLSLKNVAGGTYIVEVYDGSGTTRFKLIKH